MLRGSPAGIHALAALLVATGCSSDAAKPPAAPAPPSEETAIRDRLGVPADARRVLVFAQTSHLDLDWQETFDGYYTDHVEDVFLKARALLEAQPRAHYSIAEMAFLQHHVQVHPQERALLAAQLARGALHIVGGGMTSPDTLLPETEMLARDFLHGARFAEGQLGAARPTAAWLPDSFGHAATVPDLLVAAGFSAVAFSRVDGGLTIFEALADKARPPEPGSTAALLKELGSADFLWHGPGGGTVLAHLMPTRDLYCAGDTIDYDEPFQPTGGHLTDFLGDDREFTDAAIQRYADEREPFARTPYAFVPVGCDFQRPKERLLEYLDGWNLRHYPTTGVYAVAAPFDDYAKLVGAHAELLPEVTGALEPYFMGFYGSRAEVKRRTREAARPFFAAETLAVALGEPMPPGLTAAMELLTRADHHDFIPGTATDEVVATEQLPLLDDAEAAARGELRALAERLAARVPMAAGTTARRVVADDFAWRVEDVPAGGPRAPTGDVTLQQSADEVVLASDRVRAVLRREGGPFSLRSLQLDSEEALAGESFTVGDYADDGGLWRLGHEMQRCGLTAIPPAAAEPPESVEVLEESPARVRVAFHGATATREVSLVAGEPQLGLALVTGAAEGTTRTATFRFAGGAAGAAAPLRTSLAGGFAERAPEGLHEPTFWAAVEWATTGPWAVLLRQSTGVHFDATGTLELMAARDARSEKCDILGGTGSDPGTHRIEWALARAATPAEAARLAQRFGHPPQLIELPARAPEGADLPAEGALVTLEGAGILTAVKPAERGEGVIVRALLLPGPVTLHLGPALAGSHATLCDLAERELEAKLPAGDSLVLEREQHGAVVSVRLRR